MSTPSSVSFCTTHSGRSPLTGAKTTVIAGSARATKVTSPAGSSGSANRASAPPARAVRDGERIAGTDPEDGEVMTVVIGEDEVVEVVDEDVRTGDA